MTELLKRMSDEATSKLQGLERQLCAHHNALAFHHLEACQAILDADPRFSVSAPDFSQGSGAAASATSSAAGNLPSARHLHGQSGFIVQESAVARGDSAVWHGLDGTW